MLGLDIYGRYQTVTDWHAVRDHGVRYIWVKLTDGGGQARVSGDTLVAGAQSIGIPVGGYHFAQPSPSPEAQADVFVSELRRLDALDIPPALDLEAPFDPNAYARDFGLRFLRRVQARLGGAPVAVYMNNSFAQALRPQDWGIPGLVTWIARYGAPPSVPHDVHQYSSSGSVPGIRGHVDLNDAHIDLSTEVDDLSQYENEIKSTYGAIWHGGGDSPFDVGLLYVVADLLGEVKALRQRLEEAVIAGMYLGGPSTPDRQSMFGMLAAILGKDASADVGPEETAKIVMGIVDALPPDLANQIVDNLAVRLQSKEQA